MKRFSRMFIATLILMVFPAMVFAMGSIQQPEPQPASGYGSAENYITNGYTHNSTGSMTSGTKVYWFVPDELKYGDHAPVVIFLHGFMLLVPNIYQDHIDHLTNQGYIVIFPQFNKGFFGVFSDMDQTEMLARAIDAVDVALDEMGSIADTNDITLYGHSIGGFFALAWEAWGGVPVNRIVTANACLDASAGAPSFINITTVPVSDISQTTKPVVMLWGNEDSLAKKEQQQTAIDLLSVPVSVYTLMEDDYGDDTLKADHMAPISDDGLIPSLIMNLIGGDGEVDATDYRFYFAALDQALDGQMNGLTFNMGEWSDGTPVIPVYPGLP